MEAIKTTSGYQQIQDNKSVSDLDRFQQQHAETKQRLGPGFGGKLYTPVNAGKYFISIDLITANYNALKFYDSSIVLDTNNWHELLARFTPMEYYKHSKYFRQIVFGQLNPKKQATITKFITSEIFRALASSQPDSESLNLCFYSADELVFHCSRTENVADSPAAVRDILEQDAANIRNCLHRELPHFANFIRIEVFQLKQVDPAKPYYVKEDIDFGASTADSLAVSSIFFKCVSATFFAQVYKRYLGRPIESFDRKVYFEGFIATLDSNVFENSAEGNDSEVNSTEL